MSRSKFGTVAFSSAVLITAAANAATFTAHNLVIYRVGDGSAALTSAATAAFLDEYNPVTAATPVQSIPLPTAVSGANNILTNSGSATSEGLLSLSPNGQYLAFAGYNAATGTAGVVGSTAARTVGVVGNNGVVNTTTALTNFATGNNARAALTTDGSTLYLSGTNNGSTNNSTGGVLFTTVGATGAAANQLSTTVLNTRALSGYNGQLYVSSGSGSTRIATVGVGFPTTSGQTITNLPGITTTPASPYEFSFISLTGTTNPDTFYATDGTAIDKFYYNTSAGTWTAAGATNAVTGATFTGLATTTTAGVTTVYATTAGGLYSFNDATPFGGSITGTVQTLLVSAPTNEAFRGLAFAPTAAVPEPASLGLLGVAGLMLGRRRKA